jgi:cellulose synthase/poly-beta-1,6-N-acetylglucosamine synthase-like glycosyltransferase
VSTAAEAAAVQVSAARARWIRVLVVLTLLSGTNYVVWRWLDSINWAAWWLAVPLVLAETYSLVDAYLFGATVWRLRRRGEPPRAPAGATVDVLITTYDEPVDLVMRTARAAQAIRGRHRTWVLDDGDRAGMRSAAEAAGLGYLTRSADWSGRPRHAKAGNLNNALLATDGEFLLVLDADQVPDPAILERTLGYFDDPRVAFVQTPQWFSNVGAADPLGSQASLFYGPIQMGKDGWDAAYFCGSNAVLRRDALMQLGVVGYVRDVEQAIRVALRRAGTILAVARREARSSVPALAALDRVSAAVGTARAALAGGQPVSEVTYRFQREVDEAGREVVAADTAGLQADLAVIASLEARPECPSPGVTVVEPTAQWDLQQLDRREWSPLTALESVRALVAAVDVDLADEAQPLMPMATISVTEDMATAMRLHRLGWRSVYHHQVLARGLAPEDLRSMLHQRLRWSQGTLQVMLRENPLVQRGLHWGQRLMYLATMWSYLSGFATLVYLAAPVAYLVLGVRPVDTFGEDFLVRLLPFLVLNQVLGLVVGWRLGTWRGQQYNLALFPLWIRACATAAGNVWFGRSLGFVVTPKTAQGDGRPPWSLIRPQLVAMGVLVVAAIIGVTREVLGVAPTPEGTWVNLAWVGYDLLMLSIVLRAVHYRGPQAERETT